MEREAFASVAARTGRPWLYIGLVVALSLPWGALLIHAGALDIDHGFVIHTLMWVPAAAALTCCVLTRAPMAYLGLRRTGGRYLAWGYLQPIAYALATYAVLWLTGLAPATFAAFAQASRAALHIPYGAAVLNVALILTYGVLQSAVSAAGEEIGWRGYLIPTLLERMSYGSAVIVGGLVWAAWHMPLVLFSTYNSAAPRSFAVACFTLMIVSQGAICMWLRVRSGSVWPAAVSHACHNAAIQWWLDATTQQTGRAAWFAGEFGAGLAIGVTVFAVGLHVWAPITGPRATRRADPEPA